MRKILVAVDGSDYSKQAMKEAAKYVKDEPAKILLVNVKGYLPQNIDTKVLYSEKEDPQAKKRGEKILLDSAAFLKDNFGLEAQTKLVWGEPAEQILKTIDEEKPDLVVMGSLGVTGIKRFVMGSVSNKVINYAPTNVLIVRNID